MMMSDLQNRVMQIIEPDTIVRPQKTVVLVIVMIPL